jgi:hypothetical protein
MAAAALELGLVEAAAEIEVYLGQAFGQEVWPVLQAYHRQVVAQGLAAPQPAPDFLRRMVTLAAEGLQRRGRGEEVFMHPLFERLERGLNPAQAARQVFQQGQFAQLLAWAAVPPLS